MNSYKLFINNKNIFTFFFFFIISTILLSQNTKDSKKKKIDILNSSKIEQAPNLYEGNLVLSGNVKLFHNGATLDADTVILDQAKNLFIAKSNAYLNIGDSVRLTSKKLDYDGNTLKAIAYGNVVLQDNSQTLETDKLYYDRKTNTAYFNTRSKIIQQGNIIYSNYGLYNLNTKSTKFENNVELNSKDNVIKSDDITFFNAENKALVKGPTTISSKKNPKNYIYTEDGIYFTKTKESFLKKNSKIYYDGKILSGDELYFNEITGFGKGEKNVKIDDPKENRYLMAEYGEVYQFKDSAFVRGKPYMVKIFKKDSLFISAKLLTVARDKDKKSTIRGYHKARFFKSNIQGKCDSLVYKETIGQMHFYKNPIFWNELKQMKGDTIYAYLNSKNQQMDSIRVFQNAFAISKLDSITKTEFHQVKGRYILASFENEELNYVKVEGNAQSLVYVDEEDKKKKTKDRIGINKSDCGIIEADFIKQAVNIISCKINAQAKLFPESKLPLNARFLKDFVWHSKERLNKWQDIFVDFPIGNIDDFSPSTSELGGSSKPKNILKTKTSTSNSNENRKNSNSPINTGLTPGNNNDNNPISPTTNQN